AEALAEWARDGPADSDRHRAQPASPRRRGGPRLEGGKENHHRAESLGETGSVSWTGEGTGGCTGCRTGIEGAGRYHRTIRAAKADTTSRGPGEPASSGQ